MKVIQQYLEENAYHTFVDTFLKRFPKKGLYNAISEWKKKNKLDKKYEAAKKAAKLKKKKKAAKKKKSTKERKK